jgi:immune inhibitor A
LKRSISIILGAFVIGALIAPIGGIASAGSGRDVPGKGLAKGHSKKQPKIVRKWMGDRATAAEMVAKGQAKPNEDGVVQLKNGTFVDYALEGTGNLTTALVEYADRNHNTIPEPDRSVDNSTYWTNDFSPQHYEDMLFSDGGGSFGSGSMRDFYLEQSNGRYTWRGQVADWVKLPGTLAFYGANSREGAGSDNLNGPVYKIVKDILDTWGANPAAAGIDFNTVDVEDRYDCDGDGNFNEPDGYFDHFGIAHAGEGEEAGASPDTIWSHRWYANFNDDDGPAACKLGGYKMPGTNLWVGDYTIQPENGSVGVFSHEFGHDLGLPDLYDTSGGSENSTGFWSLMSSGSWASDIENTLDTKPVHMGAWEKFALGWTDSDVAIMNVGENKTIDLGPGEGATKGAFQALRVNLPNYSKTTTVFAPDGSDPNYLYSGQGNDIDTNATKTLGSALGTETPVTFRANWDIEVDWDYAYLEANTGSGFEPVVTSASTETSPNGQNFGHGITGSSGGWTTVTATLPAGTTAYRFRYWTDGAVIEPGFAVDSVQVGTGPVDTMVDASSYTLNGFAKLTNGSFTQSYFHYYLIESRSYIGFDESLCGAYNFIIGNFLEKQCYADGLLVWYRNSGFGDNDTALHPGAGQILPVDAHPARMVMPDGRTSWRTRWQMWDATFGVDSNSVTLSQMRGAKKLQKTYNAAPVKSFWDSSTTAYWNPQIPFNSVKTAGSGLAFDIVGVSSDRGTYRLKVYRK